MEANDNDNDNDDSSEEEEVDDEDDYEDEYEDEGPKKKKQKPAHGGFIIDEAGMLMISFLSSFFRRLVFLPFSPSWSSK